MQNAPLLSELDYTFCHKMMDQFPSEIQELSMKSVMNKIGQRESRVFIFKGPPGCGKTELISRVCRYWAKHYALRQFSLVLYVNIWDLHQDCTLWNLIEKQFKGSTVSSEKVCQWIEEQKGKETLVILDGFCHKYLNQSPLQSGKMLANILSGRSSFSKSTVVISTTYSDFVEPFFHKYIQFEILGLSNEQIGKQVIQHFDCERAFIFLSYLAENPEIKELISSPSYLIGTMYVFAHIPYDDLPVTCTQLYTSLVVLVSEWHKGKLCENFAADSRLTKFKNRLLKRGRKIEKDNSLQSQFKNALLENCRKVIEDFGDLITTVGKLLVRDAEDSDYELQDLNSTVPYLDYFLFSLEALLKHQEFDRTLMDEDAFTHFWYFVAGLQIETNSKKLPNAYYGRNCLKTTKCLSETRCITAEQQACLFSLKAEVSQQVITTSDIHSLLHCLPYMQDSHTVVLNNCFLGTQAVKELSRFLAADSWSNIYTYRHCSGIRHLW